MYIETMDVQLEFPFTRNGALYAYNRDQVKHMETNYQAFRVSAHLEHTQDLYHTWQQFYVDMGGARTFREANAEKYFGDIVEKQSKQRHKNIEDLI